MTQYASFIVSPKPEDFETVRKITLEIIRETFFRPRLVFSGFENGEEGDHPHSNFIFKNVGSRPDKVRTKLLRRFEKAIKIEFPRVFIQYRATGTLSDKLTYFTKEYRSDDDSRINFTCEDLLPYIKRNKLQKQLKISKSWNAIPNKYNLIFYAYDYLGRHKNQHYGANDHPSTLFREMMLTDGICTIHLKHLWDEAYNTVISAFNNKNYFLNV